MLLPAKIDYILKEQSCTKDALKTYNTGYIKMVFALLTKVVLLYIEATIAQIKVLSLKNLIPECKVCFAIFLVFNKQF